MCAAWPSTRSARVVTGTSFRFSAPAVFMAARTGFLDEWTRLNRLFWIATLIAIAEGRPPVPLLDDAGIPWGYYAAWNDQRGYVWSAFSAIRLFVQSVRRVQTDFVLQGNDLAAATRICQLVDGMPLGLELAAAWADMLSLDEIAEGIERSIDFLSSDWRDTPERHRSVRAVFDSSWRSLEPSERQVFRRISVFQGGFTHEAAQAVAETMRAPEAAGPHNGGRESA